MFHASQLFQMVGPEFGLYMLSFYSFIYDLFRNSYKFGNNVYTTTYNYMSGKYDTWLFLNSSGGPIQATNIENDVSDYINWIYNSTDNTLIYTESADEDARSLPWLSAKIVCGDDEYESFDDFVSSFKFISPSEVIPTPSTIVHCWSIVNKVWFTSGQNVALEIINSYGDIVTAHVFNRSDNDVQAWINLFEDEGDEEGEEGEEGEGDDGEEKEGEGDEGEEESVVEPLATPVEATVSEIKPNIDINEEIPKPESVGENLYNYTCTAEVEDIAKILEMMKNGTLPKSNE